MARSSKRPSKPKPVTFLTATALALALPEATEGTSYGTPAFFVRGKLVARKHQSGEVLVVKIDLKDRAQRLAADPDTFFITDHYLKHPLMLVRLATVYEDDLRDLLVESWRRSAPKRLVALFDETS